MLKVSRGARPKGRVKVNWSANFAYAIGLLATDGSLSINRRHICFTSKEMEQILNFQRALNIKVHIGKKSRGKGQEKKYFITQFSDVLFYQFLLSIGLTPAKSKTLGKVSIPSKYFFDFLRGCFDGDGYSYSYWDPRWRSSFMFYMGLVSASEDFIDWVRMEVRQRLGISGHIGKVKKISICYQLKYSKYEGIILVKALYKNNRGVFLKRKRLKIMKCLAIINKNLIKLVN